MEQWFRSDSVTNYKYKGVTREQKSPNCVLLIVKIHCSFDSNRT